MRFLLPQRELIADTAETHVRCMLSAGEIERRLEELEPPRREVPPGYMRRYVRLVGPASKGAVLG